MGTIHCCGGLRRSVSYEVIPQDGFLKVQFDWLETCPHCASTVCQLTRIDYENNVSIIRKSNLKARKFKEKLKNSFISEILDTNFCVSFPLSNFYLYYNEFGKKKKCFSNLSALKMGLNENFYMKIPKSFIKDI